MRINRQGTNLLFPGLLLNKALEREPVNLNHLKNAKSAYLQMAIHQPVQWYPWCEEAFNQARIQEKPVLLDIGASWCHWCHVMDRESYENPEIASLINQLFIAIKVDRDERPDIDSRYQQVVSHLTGNGGWPLTGFLTSEGNLFYGGTYFPPETRYGRPGFPELLKQVAFEYRHNRDKILLQSHKIKELLRVPMPETGEDTVPPALLLEKIIKSIKQAFDDKNGGIGRAPKFFHPSAILFALNQYQQTHDPELESYIRSTLTRMALGGVFDHLEGGFHRYSVDETWTVPHFEKMVVDNSELLICYSRAAVIFKDPLFERTSRLIKKYLVDILHDSSTDCFYSSQDADISLEDDGSYYTWTLEELHQVLEPGEVSVLTQWFDLSSQSLVQGAEGRHVLAVSEPGIQWVQRESTNAFFLDRLPLKDILQKLSLSRKKRQRPSVDKSLYVNLNGMVIRALIVYGMSWSDKNSLAVAGNALDTIIANAWDSQKGWPHRITLDTSPENLLRFLDDQVQMLLALLAGYEMSGNISYLKSAQATADIIIRDYYLNGDKGGTDVPMENSREGYLMVNHISLLDTPSSSSVGLCIQALLQLGDITGNSVYRNYARKLLNCYLPRVANAGLFASAMGIAADRYLSSLTKLTLVGRSEEPVFRLFMDKAISSPYPFLLLEYIPPDRTELSLMSPSGKSLLELYNRTQRPLAQLCRESRCQPPVDAPEELVL